MKKLIIYSLTLVLTVLFSVDLSAQDDLRIPLSRPNDPGKLTVHSVNANELIIRVHDGKDVIVKYEGQDINRNRDERKNGLRRISSSGLSLEVQEDDNEININTAPNSSNLELEIWVPKQFSLSLHIVQGDIEVYNVNGVLDVNAVNGDVKLTDVGGSALLNSVNGDVEASFVSIDQQAPMSFTTVNGDIDLALPSAAKVTAKMKTEWGDIYTDFDMDLDQDTSPNEVSNKGGKYKVTVNKWVIGKINGGGAEYLFKTLHGDISIRKK